MLLGSCRAITARYPLGCWEFPFGIGGGLRQLYELPSVLLRGWGHVVVLWRALSAPSYAVTSWLSSTPSPRDAESKTFHPPDTVAPGGMPSSSPVTSISRTR